jgi:hypothetical protein
MNDMLMQERQQTWQRKEKGFNSQLYNRTKNIKKKRLQGRNNIG